MSDNFDIKKVAREYAYSKFPLATKKENEKLIEDWIRKLDVARKIVSDFKLRITDPRGMKILDAGSGNGGTAIAFAEAGANVFGIEVSKELIDISKRFAAVNNAKPEFILYDGKKIPFGDNVFDAALSISVLEHVSDPVNYLSEILRVLKPGGYLYLAFPNRLWPRETHTLLWFVHWLPYKLAEKIVLMFKRNPLSENNLHFYNYWGLKKILKKSGGWDIMFEKGRSRNIVKKIIKAILGFFHISYRVFFPHIMLILRKKV
ncbi:MAG: class I SAM-dependent methyltransferase [Candidatus Terrybacteria bacterium]|nr:class I SAM-dependent methyltransferase [Candidatus Terrybacteria bacterium]